MLQFIYNNLDDGFTVLSLFRDFSREFDSVDLKNLLHNINVHGVRGIALNWFQSYPSNRIQYLSINGNHFDQLPVESGPLLFLIYINNFPNSSKFFKFNLFANDCTLSIKYRNMLMKLLANKMNCQLTKINHWLLHNKS